MSVKPGERPRLFGTNGIRGRPNELLTPDFCLSIGKAAATRFGAPEIAIGRDTRRSGDFVLSSVAAGVLSTGTNLIDLGILPTPALQYYCKTRKIPDTLCLIASIYDVTAVSSFENVPINFQSTDLKFPE